MSVTIERTSHGGWRPSKDRFLEILDNPLYRTIVDLQDMVTTSTTGFWSRRGVKSLHLPITTGSISSPMGLGSDSLPVEVDLFGERTFLADSMQFMLEYGCRLSPRGAWYMMPSFRGEDCDESHLNQFFHSEAEIPGGLDDVIAVVDAYVREMTSVVLDQHADAVASLAGTTDHLTQMLKLESFPRITFDEAVTLLGGDPLATRQHGSWRTLTRHGERRLLQEVSPVLWVTHYDHLSVPFYQGYGDAERRTALNGDLLFGLGEIVGCGERHVDGAQTRAALAHHEVSEDSYEWYVRMKQERPMRTSGFGLGIERYLMWVLGQRDIRELQLAPRLNGVTIAP
ncbi:amino acid--tRNA ligase-related protein [Micromonospora sp. NPDC050417]|uniref:amino acid--tRNA ligase-related protein n=1 Tax=Micromonospora sp. NPDC050417 TaxID=3364280 RepID=UPI0037B92229